MDSGELASDDRAVLDQTVSHIEDRVKILRDAEPYLIDMSAREASLSSYLGHMLSDKVELYRMTCDLGFHDIGLPDFFAFPSVADDLMDYLVAENLSLDPFFSTIAVEPLVEGVPFLMDPAASQTVHYGITNVILLVETRPSTLADIGTTNEKMLDDLRQHVRECRRILPAHRERRGRIYVRLAEPFDTYDDDPAYLLQIIKMLGQEDITGLLFEDVKGTRFPFETFALVQMMHPTHLTKH